MYVVGPSPTGYAVAFISVRGEPIALSDHCTIESAKGECLRLARAARLAAAAKTPEAPADGPRFARPVRWFPPDDFA
jgi:hypothetical protein